MVGTCSMHGEMRNAYNILKICRKRPFGRLRRRW